MPASDRSAVDKALDLLEEIARAQQPPRLSELADRLGLRRPTAYRVLADLVRRGWVLRVGDRYLPGPGALRLSRTAAARSLAVLALPVLEEVARRTGMMANLQVPERDRTRVVDVVRPARLEMISDMRDALLPVHRFAGPLALVAALPATDREPYLRAAQEAGCVLEGPGGLLAALEEAQRSGFAVQRGRTQQLVGSAGRAVAGPDGAPWCALTLVGPADEFDAGRLPALVTALAAAGARLESLLAGDAP